MTDLPGPAGAGEINGCLSSRFVAAGRDATLWKLTSSRASSVSGSATGRTVRLTCWLPPAVLTASSWRDAAVPWLALNRAGLAILVHPLTGDDVADHSAHALWLGGPLPLDVEALRPVPSAHRDLETKNHANLRRSPNSRADPIS